MASNQWRFNDALSNVGSFWANRIMQNQERDRIEAERQRRINEQKAELAKQQAQFSDAIGLVSKLKQGGTVEDFGMLPTQQTTPYLDWKNSYRQTTSNPNPNISDVSQLPPDLQIKVGKNMQQQNQALPTSEEDFNNIGTINVNKPTPTTVQDKQFFKPYNEGERSTYAQKLFSNPQALEAIGAWDKYDKMLNPKSEYTNFQKDNPNIAFDKVTNTWRDIRTGGQVDPMQYAKPDYIYGKDNKYVQMKDPITGQLQTALDDKGQPIKNTQWDAPEERISVTFKNGKAFEQWGKPTWEESTTNPSAYKKVGDMNYRLGRTHSYNVTDVNAKGDNVPRLTKGMDTFFNDKHKGVLDAKAGWMTEKQNKTGKATEWAKSLASRRQDYANSVYSAATPEYKQWYDGLYKIYGSDIPSGDFLDQFNHALKTGQFKTTYTLKNSKGETKTVVDPGGAASDFFREHFRAFYDQYPNLEIYKPESNDEWTVVSER